MKAAAFAILCLALIGASPAAERPGPATGGDTLLVDGVAAFVNGEAITIRDVVSGVPEQIRAMSADPAFRAKDRDAVFTAAYDAALQEAINRRLVIQAYWAGEQRIPESALQRSLNEVIESRYGGDVAALQADLATSRMTYADWRKMMEEQIIVRSMRQTFVSANVHVSPNEIATTYAARKHELAEPEKVHVLTFALPQDDSFEANLTRFHERLAAGEAFEDIARDLSVDAMADAGGDYGWIVPDELLAPVLAEAVNALADGARSEPVTLGNNAYVLFRKASQPARTRSLRDVQEQIERERHDAEARRIYQGWTERLRETAQIRIFDVH